MTGIVAQNVGRASGLIKAASGGGGVWTHIKTLTASSDSTLDFVNGTADVVLDSTYPVYVFQFVDLHFSATGQLFFNASADTGSNYNVTKTSVSTSAYHAEDGSGSGYYYITSGDLSQSTAFQQVSGAIYTDNDSSMSGELHLFNPSSTTYVKHFISETQNYSDTNQTINAFIGGYFNTTSAINAIQY